MVSLLFVLATLRSYQILKYRYYSSYSEQIEAEFNKHPQKASSNALFYLECMQEPRIEVPILWDWGKLMLDTFFKDKVKFPKRDITYYTTRSIVSSLHPYKRSIMWHLLNFIYANHLEGDYGKESMMQYFLNKIHFKEGSMMDKVKKIESQGQAVSAEYIAKLIVEAQAPYRKKAQPHRVQKLLDSAEGLCWNKVLPQKAKN